MKPDFLTKSFLEIVIIILLIPVLVICTYFVINDLTEFHFAHAQSTATVQGQSAGNLQFLPQQAYIYTEPPMGVQPSVQQSTDFGIKDILTALSGIAGGGAIGKFFSKKNEDKIEQEVKPVVREVAQTQVKIADAQLETNKQVFENMADKGVSIQDKPAIKVEELQKTKDKAVETATKS